MPGGIYVKQTKGSVVLKDGMYYVHPDHLGSVPVVTDATGNIVQKCTFDAWGRRSFVTKDRSLIFDRGFTGHEHLDEFGLINMNGRMYDPIVGRFLSPDPYVQDTEFSQSFNRYSYCWNNPLNYTDPSGELIGELLYIGLMVYLSGVQSNFMYAAENGGNPFNPGDWNRKSPWTYVSMASAGFGAYNQIGGLNGFKDVTASASTFGSSSEDFLRWVDSYEATHYKGALMSYGPGKAKYIGNDTYEAYLRGVTIMGHQSRHAQIMSLPIVQAIHQGHSGFWNSPATQVVLSVIPIMPAVSSAFKAISATSKISQVAAKGGQGGLNLFKWGAEQTGKSTGWKTGDYMLHLPNKGTPKLNWKANYGALRNEMKLGKPIFDSYRFPNGNLIPTSGFLNAERYILQSRGWTYNLVQGAWLPPIY